MGPLRIVILAILLYIGYRLLVGSAKKNKTSGTDKKSAGPNAKITDVLVEDPICHKLVPQQQAVRLDRDGETLYFCSEECCKQFTSEKGEDV